MKEHKEFYKDNQLKAIGLLNEQGKQRLWKYYSKNGNLQKEIFYKDDEKNGVFKRYYDNGQVAIEANYINGKSEGVWKEYYDTGALKEEGKYEDGEYIPLNYWDEKGNQTLINGTGIKTETFGASDNFIVAQHYEKGKFVREEKITTVSYGQFILKKSPLLFVVPMLRIFN